MMDGIRESSVTKWFVENIPHVLPPLTFDVIAGGRSNITFKVTDAGGKGYVLRRPPIGYALESAHDMGREYKIISSLGPTDVPVVPALGLCRDKSVNDADFYVMQFVEGRVFADSIDAADIPLAKRRDLTFDMMDILVRLHRIDPDDVGLGDLGRKENYAARQVQRWIRQWENSKTEDVPEMEEVKRLLQDNIPAQSDATIVHGDFRIGNFILQDYKVAAVLDWELCTLGDPQADLAWLLNWWYSANEVDLGRGDQAPTAVAGFPAREALVDYYQRSTGRDLSRVNYFRALSYWKLATIAQGVYRRYHEGAMIGEGKYDLASSKRRIHRLAQAALAMLQN